MILQNQCQFDLANYHLSPGLLVFCILLNIIYARMWLKERMLRISATKTLGKVQKNLDKARSAILVFRNGGRKTR